jgi:hypothetical protein
MGYDASFHHADERRRADIVVNPLALYRMCGSYYPEDDRRD